MPDDIQPPTLSGSMAAWDERIYQVQKSVAAGRASSVYAQSANGAGGYGLGGGPSCCGGGKVGPMLRAYARHRPDYSGLKLKDLFRTARDVVACNSFAEWVHGARMDFASLGFHFTGDGRGYLDERFGPRSEVPYDFAGVAEDAWREYLTCDNAVAYWIRNGEQLPEDLPEGSEDAPGNQPGALPFISILNSEDVKYTDGMGVECLTLCFSRRSRNWKSAQKRAIEHCKVDGDPATHILVQKMANGEDVTLTRNLSDGFVYMQAQEGTLKTPFDFCVLKTAKRGHGLGRPRISTVFDDLDLLELLKCGDWNGAWFHKDIWRTSKKGYEISSGQFAGMSTQHMKPAESSKLRDGSKAGHGNVHVAANFDVDFDYFLFPTEFFDDAKFRASNSRLMSWAGSAALMLNEGHSIRNGVSPYLTMALRAEFRTHRERMAKFLGHIFNSRSFLGARHAQEAPDLVTGWDESILYTTDELRNGPLYLRAEGLVSSHSTREFLGLDHEKESARLKAEHADRECVTPSFEQKQGHVPVVDGEGSSSAGNGDGGQGGRPPSQDITPGRS